MRFVVVAAICGSLLIAGRASSQPQASTVSDLPQSSAKVLPSLERQSLADRVIKAFHLDRATRLGFQAAWQVQRDELAKQAKAAPSERAAKIMAAYDSAVREGQDAFFLKLLPKLRESIADSTVTDDDLREFLGLYESPFAQRTLPPNQSSPEDRQA